VAARANPWVIAVVVAMAAFMEVLDTRIANVSLPHMAGSLGASYDQSTWVLTSHLVSNAIVLPMTGWLAAAFGRKRFFMVACCSPREDGKGRHGELERGTGRPGERSCRGSATASPGR